MSKQHGPTEFECNASFGDHRKTFFITLSLNPYELTICPRESQDSTTTHIPYCCIYGYNTPDSKTVEDSSQNRMVTVYYVEFTSPNLSVVSSPRLAKVDLFLQNQPDVQRFLSLAEQLRVFPKSRQILLLVNPSGGVGKAKTISDTIVKPMLECSGLTFQEKYTEYGRHAVDIAHKVDLKELDMLIVVSGDGVLHEIINGLLTRSDWEQARQLPVGIIPAGSGNAIATSIGTRNPIVSTLAVIRGETSKFDIFSLSQLDRPRIYAMLMFSWGMMADADIESDKYRWLGSLRFDIAGLVRMIRLRRYPGKVYVLPPKHKANSNETTKQELTKQNEPALQYNQLLKNTHEEPPSPWRLLPNMPFYSLLVLINCPSAGETVLFSDTIRFNDGIMRLLYSCETRPWKIFLPFVMDLNNGKILERGLMQDIECGGLLIVPGVEGKPDDPSTHEIAEPDLVVSESAKKNDVYRKPGVFDVDGEVMPTARTLIEVLPSFMNMIVPEWHYHEQELLGEEGKEESEQEIERARLRKHKRSLVVEASKRQEVKKVNRIREVGMIVVVLVVIAVTVPTIVKYSKTYLKDSFHMWSSISSKRQGMV